MSSISLSELGRHRGVALTAVLVYSMAACVLIWLGRYRLNSDAICYVQMARHLLEGQLGLAVNSWWSPAFPSLLIPGIAMGMEGMVWARIVQVPAGLCFAYGVSTLLRRWQGTRGTLAAFILGLCAALAMQTGVITPDIWNACVLTWYFVVAHSLLTAGGLGRAAWTGVLGGVAYLTKAYSLPFVLVHLTVTCGLHPLGQSERRGWGRALGQWAVAVALLLSVSSPWIALISRHDHEFTISSAGRYWTVAQPIEVQDVALITRLYAVPTGRFTPLESIRDLPIEWKPAPPFAGLKDQLKITRRSLAGIFDALGHLDGVGLTKALLLLCVVLVLPWRDAARDPTRLFVVWGLLSLAIYLGGYALVYFEDRFLWAVWGLMLVLCVGGPEAILGRIVSGARDGRMSSDTESLGRFWHGGALLGIGGLILVNTSMSVVAHLAGDAYRFEVEIKQAATRMSPGRVIAATDWASGICFAFWNHGRYLGAPIAVTPEAIAEELRPFEPCLLLVVKRPALAKSFASHPSFQRVELDSQSMDGFEFNEAARR